MGLKTHLGPQTVAVPVMQRKIISKRFNSTPTITMAQISLEGKEG